MRKRIIRLGILALLQLLTVASCHAQREATPNEQPHPRDRTPPTELAPQPAAVDTAAYLPLLRGKHIALVANHTSSAGGQHLIDRLLAHGVHIRAIFTPEHGLKGLADAGELVGNSVHQRGIRIYSLYGERKHPTDAQLEGIDLVVYDLQDVGVRCYTYLSTLQHMMEACAARGIPLVVLDRPNPNGHYVDGPVLEPRYRSFVGMQPVPWVHGMTTGEYAQMLNGEGWLRDSMQCPLTVIRCPGYTHAAEFTLSIPPSPNLRNQNAVYLYASLALFEGTGISVGRGTGSPFELIGSPTQPKTGFSFTPRPTPGAKNPPHRGRECHGLDLRKLRDSARHSVARLNLAYLIGMHRNSPRKDKFFTRFFDQLAGTSRLRKSIEAGESEAQIREGWTEELKAFRHIRRKYLLYPDTKQEPE